MPRTVPSVPEISVFLSSPGDVGTEREIVKQIIREINADPAWQNRCVLKPLAYEDCVPSQMGKSAQRVVDDFMRMSCEADIVVCILCNRMGTPTIDQATGESYHSGTHYEFDAAYKAFTHGGGITPRIMLFLGSRDLPDDSSDEETEQYLAARKFKKQLKSSKEYEGLYVEYRELDSLEELIRNHLKKHLDQILGPSPVPIHTEIEEHDSPRDIRAYLAQLAEHYRWLELQGIREAGALRIELEKVYVALKTEPESEYDRQQAAHLHAVEVQETAGAESIEEIDPKKLEELDALNLRRTFRPGREQAKRALITEVRTLGDAFRQHRRMVILGGPGSGKTTLGRWLALQLARGLLQRMEIEVAPESRTPEPGDIRFSVPANCTTALSEKPIVVRGKEKEETQNFRINALPTRGVLKLAGVAVPAGHVIEFKQINLLTYTPVVNESGTNYTHFRYSAGTGELFGPSLTAVIDVQVHLLVPASQLDSDTRSLSHELVDIGPVRLPIFLRLVHFARELAERERQHQPSIALLDYLGHDPDSCGLSDGFTPETRNALFCSNLQKQQAVVVLDGLDELSDGNRRTVVLKIQDFMEKFLTEKQLPWECGGNQVVVTSRYVGYKFAPVQAGCTHFGIQPMQRPSVERFAYSWTDAVNVELAAEGEEGLEADRLIAEIYSEAKPKVRELATNPLLVTILATVYWRDGQLPDQRAGVYDRVVENLLEIWLKREECLKYQLTREELLAALEPLAADMQENASTNGLISLGRIGELIEGPLAELRGLNPNHRSFRPVKDAFLETIRKHVGLLAEESAGNYKFFHRTFQEFLAARHLLADRPRAAEKMRERLDDPLWREPLLLALGFAMLDWGPEQRSRLLADVLAADAHDTLIPRAALLLVTALPDLRNTPGEVVGQMAGRLLTSYAISQELKQAGGLGEQIEQAFARLLAGQQADTVTRQVAAFLRGPAGTRDLSSAIATILRRINWFTTELVESLLLAVHRDRADLDWPIQRALMAALGHRPGGLPWLLPSPALNLTRLLGTHLPMRKLLEASPELVVRVQADSDWLSLLVALYGGLGQIELFEQYDRHQLELLQSAKTVASPVAVVLDLAPASFPPIPTLKFSPQDIVHDLTDSHLSRMIQRQLSARKPARDLLVGLRQRWEAGGEPTGSAEALIGLAALGEDVLPLLSAAFAKVESQPAAHAALAHFSWLRAFLREPLLRATEGAVRTIPDNIPEQCQLDLLEIALSAHMSCGGGPLPISDKIPAYRVVSATTPAARATLDAEYWSYLFSGIMGEGGSGLAHFASVFTQVSLAPDDILHSWSLLPNAQNHLAARRLPWSQPSLLPRADTRRDRFLAMLDAMNRAPREFHSIAGYLLGRCWPVVEEHPSLIWETLAICCSQGEEFLRGFLKHHEGRREDASELHQLESQILATLMPTFLEADKSLLLSRLTLLDQLFQIPDQYLRFRAVWRLLGAVGEEHSLDMNLMELVEHIPDPHEQIRALEWILMTIPETDVGLVNHIGLLDPMVATLARIADPENRARAQCRVAFFATDHLETLLHDAVDSIRAIADPSRKVETIREIRAAWGRTAGLSETLDAVAESIPVVWLRNKALERDSRLIETYRPKYSIGAMEWRLPPDAHARSRVFRRNQPTGCLPWALISLDAMATEAESVGTTSASGAADWDKLLGKDKNPAIAALAVAGLEVGVPVTARVVSILDRVLQAGQAAELEGLWPFLERPDPGAIGMVARWTSRRDRSAQWSALVQAEAGILNPEVVGLVVDLLSHSTDRLRIRAAIALHGPTPYVQNKKRRWSVRRVGAETLNALARCATETSHIPANQTTMNWARSDIHHDDREALEGWLEQTAIDGRESPAAWILKSLQSVDAEIVPALVSALKNGSPEVQAPLLFGMATLANCCKEFSSSAKELHTAVAAVPHEIRAGLFVLPKGPETVLQIAKEAAQAGLKGDGLHQVRRLVE